jgi:hypothetical protein
VNKSEKPNFFYVFFTFVDDFKKKVKEKVTPLGFKPKTFRTGICHSISLSIPLFMGIFGIPQKRICADFAPIRLVNTLLSVAKVRISEQKAKIIMDFFE